MLLNYFKCTYILCLVIYRSSDILGLEYAKVTILLPCVKAYSLFFGNHSLCKIPFLIPVSYKLTKRVYYDRFMYVTGG